MLGLIAFSVIGAYLYYPDRRQCFDEMAAVHADAVVATRTGKRDEAIRHLERWDLLTRKLQVGVYIRAFRVGREQEEAAEDLRERLEEVRDALLNNDPDGARGALPALETAYHRCRTAFTSGATP